MRGVPPAGLLASTFLQQRGNQAVRLRLGPKDIVHGKTEQERLLKKSAGRKWHGQVEQKHRIAGR